MNLQFAYGDQDEYGINYLAKGTSNNKVQNKKSPVKKVQFKDPVKPFEGAKPIIINKGRMIKQESKTKKTKSGIRPKTAMTKKTVTIKKEWNDNVVTSGLFDPSLKNKRTISPKEKREYGRGKEQESYASNAAKAAKAYKTTKGKENSKIRKSPNKEDTEIQRMEHELDKKRAYVKSLEEELSNEKALRAQMNTEYAAKIDSTMDFVKNAIDSFKKRDTELDLIPQKETPQTIQNLLITKKEITKKDPKNERVKKADVKIIKRPKPPIFKPFKNIPRTNPIVAKPTTKPAAKSFTSKMKQREIQRQSQLEYKTQQALKQLSNLPYTENKETTQLMHTLEHIKDDMQPVMEQVGKSIQEIERVERIRNKGSTMEMISNMGARYIVGHIDQLTKLIADDLMEELAVEMNEIEREQKEKFLSVDQQELALKLLGQANELEEEQARIRNKWLRADRRPETRVSLDIIEPKQYANPFETAPTNLEEEKLITVYRPHKKQLILPKEVSARIHGYAKANKRYKKKIESSTDPEIWKVYDYITHDIVSEVLIESSVELSELLEQYLEHIIANEFKS